MSSGVYLCGPIAGCTDEECRNWRLQVIEKLDKSIPIFDPMVRDYRGRELEKTAEIVELDKADIDHSSVLIVNYDKPSVGTSMEILYAWERGKVIILVTREDVILSPWLRYHSSAITHTFDEAVCLIHRLYGVLS